MGQGKKYGDLFGEISSPENLYRAAKKAIKGKKNKRDVQKFLFSLEENLYTLREELVNKTYTPGKYRTFMVYDPKERMISAAPFRDRVVHHSLTNVIEPIFEKVFSPYSFANRKGKGTHKAIDRAQKLSRKYAYYLKGDIQKYFPSIDHQILKKLIGQKISCPDTLWLIDRIIDHSNIQQSVCFYFKGDTLFTPHERRRGLPLGNQTSQFFANVYLNPLDQFVCRILRAPGYVRYVDDFVVFGKTKEDVTVWKVEIEKFLQKYRLRIHQKKSQIHPVKRGIPFLGWRIWPYLRRISNKKIVLFIRRIKKKKKEYCKGITDLKGLQTSLQGWIAHAKHGDTFELRKDLLRAFTL